MKPLKLSHTSISRYLECPRKYRLHDIEKIRPERLKSALVYGSCLDEGLNLLLNNKSMDEAFSAFKDKWSVYKSQDIIYSKSDLDLILLNHFKVQTTTLEWDSLLLKGKLALEAYNNEFVPQIKNIISVQKKIKLTNNTNDEINGIIDLVVELKDNKIYIIDNKSSSVKYEPDSPKKSQQLVLYYYIEKDYTKIDAVGFAVMGKKIEHNKKRICSACEMDCSGRKYKSCPDCKNTFIETYDPKCKLEVITNEITEKEEERVLTDIDMAATGIKNKQFEPNLKACNGIYGKCEFYNLCHGISMEGLTRGKK